VCCSVLQCVAVCGSVSQSVDRVQVFFITEISTDFFFPRCAGFLKKCFAKSVHCRFDKMFFQRIVLMSGKNICFVFFRDADFFSPRCAGSFEKMFCQIGSYGWYVETHTHTQ